MEKKRSDGWRSSPPRPMAALRRRLTHPKKSSLLSFYPKLPTPNALKHSRNHLERDPGAASARQVTLARAQLAALAKEFPELPALGFIAQGTLSRACSVEGDFRAFS